MAKKISMTQAVREFADAMTGAHDQSNIVTQCVNACSKHFQGDAPDAKSVKEFADGVAEIREWSESSAKARKSEVRNIVREYVRLPSAVKAIRDDKRCDSFTWHNAVKVARLCKSHKTDSAVVKAYFETKPSKSATPVTKINKALEVALSTTTTSPKYKGFQTALSKLLAKHEIQIDV